MGDYGIGLAESGRTLQKDAETCAVCRHGCSEAQNRQDNPRPSSLLHHLFLPMD